MDLELIRSMESPFWMYLAAPALLAVTVGAMIAVTYYIENMKIAGPLAILITVVMLVSAFCFIEHETSRTEDATASVSEGFDRDYGLNLSDRDLGQLWNVRQGDVTRNVETADGSLKEVLFRAVDDKVLPYTMDSEGTWTPVPSTADAK